MNPQPSPYEYQTILSMLRLMTKFSSDRTARRRVEGNPIVAADRVCQPHSQFDGNCRRMAAARRIPFEANVIVSCNGQTAEGHVVDISSTGILIRIQSRLEAINGRVALEIHPHDTEEQFKTFATIVREEEDQPGYGLKFSIL